MWYTLLRVVSPSAASPANTSAAPALKSEDITSAPVNGNPPFIMATPCLIIISAPILLNSGTCINLFSNTVSSIELEPFTSV